MPAPDLDRLDVANPRGLVLMLHGGRENGLEAVNGRSASWRRARAMMGSILAGAHEAGASVWLLRYARRGWNGGLAQDPSPVPDARWALQEVRRAHGTLPVVLLGHSMGARTAVHVADDDAVVGVVGLAPWLPVDEPVHALAGRHLAVAHGSHDRITSPRATRAYVDRARTVTRTTEFHDMGPVGHYMFRRAGAWNDFALSRSLGLLERARTP